jgi:hypothetical protein
MLASHCFGREWIDRWANDLRSTNRNILETAIAALQFVGHLAEADLPFQFRGGTCLMLLVQPVRRLSVDVDIVTQATPSELEEVLRRVGTLTPFEGYEHDPARDRALPPAR